MTIRYFTGWSRDLVQWAKKNAPEKIPKEPKKEKINRSCECGKEQTEYKVDFCWGCDTFTTAHYYLVNKNTKKNK